MPSPAKGFAIYVFPSGNFFLFFSFLSFFVKMKSVVPGRVQHVQDIVDLGD